LQMDFADGFSPAWILPFSAKSFSALTLHRFSELKEF
jgi:hypothetical protein